MTQQRWMKLFEEYWLKFTLAAIGLFLIYSIAYPLSQGKSPISRGLDIVGGVVVSYRPDFSTTSDVAAGLSEAELLKLCKEILTNRLERSLNVIPDVLISGDNHIIISVPNVHHRNDVLQIVGKTYRLTIRRLVSVRDEAPPDLQSVKYKSDYLVLDNPTFTGDMLDLPSIKVEPADTSSLNPEHRYPSVSFSFKPPFNQQFEKFTKDNLGKDVVILLDDQVKDIIRIKGVISDTGSILGKYSLDEAKDLAAMLRSGSLPLTLVMESLSEVGPSLGQQVLESGNLAAVLSALLILILFFIAYIYRPWFMISGLASIFILSISIVGLTAATHLTIDFGGLAGIILAIGMGMDAFIIIFESLEPKLKHNFSTSQIALYADTIISEIYSFPSVGRILFHSNLATVMTVAFLLNFDRVRYFAWTVMIGVAASIYSIFVTRELLRAIKITSATVYQSPLTWLRNARPKIYRYVTPYLVATAVVVCISAFLIISSLFGKNYITFGGDFQAGTQVVCEVPKISDLDAALKEIGTLDKNISITKQEITSKLRSSQQYLINIAGLQPYVSQADAGAARSQETTSSETLRLPGFGDKSARNNPPLQGDPPKTSEVPHSAGAIEGTPSNAASPLTIDKMSSLFLVHNVKVLSLYTVDNKVSSRQYFSSLSVMALSFLLLTIYFLFIQNPLDRIFTRKKPNVLLIPSSNLWITSGVLIALVHDLSFVVIGCFIAGIHYSLAVLAGILTTIGYSVMDSLVLWTNIQSRAQILLKEDYSPKDIVTSSIDNILSRDVLTSMCTMIPSIVILGLGISPLRDFAWTMLIGTVAGTLSSIFIIGACAERTLAMTVFSRDSAPRPATVRVTANERLSKQQIFERMHSHD